MPKYVAFLRAINVGGHTVKMDHLRGLFEAVGFLNVETFIASGNVIFDSTSRNTKALEAKVEGHLTATLGYEVRTFIRSIPEVSAVASYKPFSDAELSTEGNIVYVGFLAGDPAAEAVRQLESAATAVDDFHVFGREVYWLCRTKFSESPFSGARLEKTLGMKTTIRNSTTVRKLAAKYS